jgi:hypothetical protein
VARSRLKRNFTDMAAGKATPRIIACVFQAKPSDAGKNHSGKVKSQIAHKREINPTVLSPLRQEFAV